MSGQVFPLHGAQRDAVEPRDTVWLSASAGTGKTQVLSARVLRLLLQSQVEPSQILCLTFTKAGAAEMATRVNSVLARWVRLDDTKLGEELGHIGAPLDPDTRARARTLFASVLDCPGGGLRIDTIHAFAQWLLATFPAEAGIKPGLRAMEDRDRDLLAEQVLADMLAEAEQAGDASVIEPVETLSLRLGPDGARGFLMACAGAREAWFGPGAWTGPIRPRLLEAFGLEGDAAPGDLAEECGDGRFAMDALAQCVAANRAWGTASGIKCADAVGAWLGGTSAERLERLDDLTKALFTNDGNPRSLKSLEKQDPSYGERAEALRAAIEAIAERRRIFDLVDWLAPVLGVGRRFAAEWDAAKAREGWVDFDDLIHRAAALLKDSAGADWIRYKLDRRFDHILVDEAQDTNAAQWDIIRALADDFFDGAGQREGRSRSLFVVGDYKQAIFGFQGTSPTNFREAREDFERRIDAAAAAAGELRMPRSELPRPLQALGLTRSFRTARPVLDFVDRAIAAVGPGLMGLDDPQQYESHVGEDRPGLVTLWGPTLGEAENEDTGEEGFLDDADRALAERIARQVKAWLADEPFPLAKHGRNATAGDVMVLVRKRKDLAGLIVARLYAAGVPVAGVDRLRLGAPLAVQDLMAALRFAVQPRDDLTLASLLVSPLVGWSQEELLEYGYRERGGLWDHLRDHDAPRVRQTVEHLRTLMARADFGPPEDLLQWLLTGPWQARRALVARLGAEANDPIDELVNAAFAYSASHIASLQGFIRWFDAGEGEVKREPGAAGDRVRVMTVHGAKGLQAPIVILADATGDPETAQVRGLSVQGEGNELVAAPEVPVPAISSAEQPQKLRDARAEAKARELEEHWRLLYVAMTRAEEALFVTGALTAAQTKKGVPEKSWFAALEPLFDGDRLDDPRFGWRQEWGARAGPQQGAASTTEAVIDLPEWATRPIGPEPRPPRPLSPSGAGEDLAPDPPTAFTGDGGVAARRGTMIHRLLERLPDMPAEHRRDGALRWLGRQAPDLADSMRAEMVDAALAVLDDGRWADLFGPDSLAEVPLAATVEGQVIAGTADRLLVTAETVRVVDYKTTRRPPAGLADVPRATLAQMGAYAAALRAIYPGRRVEAALLYTHAPALIAIPAEILGDHKPRLPDASERFGA